jgi:O-antigen/teichoic acid export membrane protein
MHNLTRIAGGTAFTIAVTFAGLGLNYCFNVFLARWIGAEAFGAFNTGFAVFGILCLVGVMGLDNAALRFLPGKGEAAMRRLVGKVLRLAASSALLVCLLAYACHGWVIRLAGGGDVLLSVLPFFLAAIPPYVIGIVVLAILQARQLVYLRMVAKYLVEPVAKYVVVFGLIALGYGLAGALIGFVSACVASLLVAGWGLARLLNRPATEPATIDEAEPSALGILSYTGPLVVGILSCSIANRSDILLLSYYQTASQVGLYCAAYQTAAILAIILQCVESVAVPYISEAINKKNHKDLRQLYTLSLRWVYLLGLPLFLLFETFSEDIMRMFGEEFTSAGTCLAILAAAQMLNLATGSANAVLVYSGRSRLILGNSLLQGFLQAGINLWAIPRYGMLGAAATAAVVMSLVNLLRLVQVYRWCGAQPYRAGLLKPTVAALVCAFAVQLWQAEFTVTLGFVQLAGCFVLCTALILFSGMETEDWALCKSVLIRLTPGQALRWKN